ncbi:MAG: imidazoleglycerol-phosphate dehydratase [Spirochaetota bacterium]
MREESKDLRGAAGQAGSQPRRRAILRRKTRETEIILDLDLDGGTGGGAVGGGGSTVAVSTGIGFLDHLVSSLARHAGFSLSLRCHGDLEIDDHHSAEDCALILGEGLAIALSRGAAPVRFGHAYAPLDEALARAVVDFSGRPYATVELGLGEGRIGELAAENVGHFLESLAMAATMTIHVDVLRHGNAHHAAEAAFKALALALRTACAERVVSVPGATSDGPASTKGAVLLEELDPQRFASEDSRLAAAAGVAAASRLAAAAAAAAAIGSAQRTAL